jgi:hypothetical protein
MLSETTRRGEPCQPGTVEDRLAKIFLEYTAGGGRGRRHSAISLSGRWQKRE